MTDSEEHTSSTEPTATVFVDGDTFEGHLCEHLDPSTDTSVYVSIDDAGAGEVRYLEAEGNVDRDGFEPITVLLDADLDPTPRDLIPPAEGTDAPSHAYQSWARHVRAHTVRELPNNPLKWLH